VNEQSSGERRGVNSPCKGVPGRANAAPDAGSDLAPGQARSDFLCFVAVVAWLLLLISVFPFLDGDSNVGDTFIRHTVRLALLYYAAAASLMLLLSPDNWPARTSLGRLARCCWTLGWAAYLIHVGMAFHFAHAWSHALAVEHTRQRSGIGEGIYVSHLFTLLWTADVLTWWLSPGRYAMRNPWIGRTLHAFMVFMVFNGTVVFEEGFIRWAGVGLCTVLAACWRATRMPERRDAGTANETLNGNRGAWL
jgi:hypothetical protein